MFGKYTKHVFGFIALALMVYVIPNVWSVVVAVDGYSPSNTAGAADTFDIAPGNRVASLDFASVTIAYPAPDYSYTPGSSLHIKWITQNIGSNGQVFIKITNTDTNAVVFSSFVSNTGSYDFVNTRVEPGPYLIEVGPSSTVITSRVPITISTGQSASVWEAFMGLWK